jgi:outer membrane protein assembly factor BamB
MLQELTKRVLVTSTIFSLLAGCGAEDTGSSDVEPGLAKVGFRIESRPGQPAIADGIIYVGSQAGNFYAVEMDTGRELWSFSTGGPVFHAPLVSGDFVVFGSWDGRLRAADKNSGELIWEFAAGQVDWEVRDVFINGIPTLLDGVLYFSSEDFNVYAVELETGREVWRLTLGEEPQARRIPIVDRTAYIGTWDGHLYAIDIDSGSEVWRSETDDERRAAMSEQVPFVTVVPIVTAEAVYFSDWAGNLFAVDRNTGKQVWRFDPGATNSRHVGSRSFMAEHDGVLFYSTLEDHHLYGVDRGTGQVVWSTTTEGIAYGPVPAGHGIGIYAEFVAGQTEGETIKYTRAMDLASREVLWTTDDSASVPNIEGGLVYYAGADGIIRGRDLLTGEEVFRLGL